MIAMGSDMHEIGVGGAKWSNRALKQSIMQKLLTTKTRHVLTMPYTALILTLNKRQSKTPESVCPTLAA